LPQTSQLCWQFPLWLLAKVDIAHPTKFKSTWQRSIISDSAISKACISVAKILALTKKYGLKPPPSRGNTIIPKLVQSSSLRKKSLSTVNYQLITAPFLKLVVLLQKLTIVSTTEHKSGELLRAELPILKVLMLVGKTIRRCPQLNVV
jgi:hypothetical protein